MVKLAIRMHVAWYRFKADERGAQTLEWLALALLILAILGAATGFSNGAFGDKLKTKFLDMVDKIGKS